MGRDSAGWRQIVPTLNSVPKDWQEGVRIKSQFWFKSPLFYTTGSDGIAASVDYFLSWPLLCLIFVIPTFFFFFKRLGVDWREFLSLLQGVVLKHTDFVQ